MPQRFRYHVRDFRDDTEVLFRRRVGHTLALLPVPKCGHRKAVALGEGGLRQASRLARPASEHGGVTASRPLLTMAPDRNMHESFM